MRAGATCWSRQDRAGAVLALQRWGKVSKGRASQPGLPEDRSWLVSTLWDDEWACIGGSRCRHCDRSRAALSPPGTVGREFSFGSRPSRTSGPRTGSRRSSQVPNVRAGRCGRPAQGPERSDRRRTGVDRRAHLGMRQSVVGQTAKCARRESGLPSACSAGPVITALHGRAANGACGCGVLAGCFRLWLGVDVGGRTGSFRRKS
jgi:hypothetical protein